MKCSNCGRELEEWSKYCEYCGFNFGSEKNRLKDKKGKNTLNIFEVDNLKKCLKEKNEKIESLKENICKIRKGERRKSKCKITILTVLLLISIFIIVIISIRLSVSLRYGNNICSENSDLLSINEELQKENEELKREYKGLEENYLLLEESSKKEPKSNLPEDDNGLAEIQKEKEAPKVRLEVYEGPLYNEYNNICYYRIRAIVTGNPKAEVTFSKDDSSGAWGKYVTQVNLTDPNETYELVVTAKNSMGEAKSSLILSWGCE